MPLTLSQIALPAFVQGLDALDAILAKAAEHASAKTIKEPALLQARLFPDMLPFTAQVQIACDFAKGAAARLGGVEVPSFPDTEASFAELRERIAKTLEVVRGVPADAIDAGEDRHIVLKGPGRTLEFNGRDYLLSFVLPNFYFHLATAYGLLRHGGLEIGKRDFIGAVRLS